MQSLTDWKQAYESALRAGSYSPSAFHLAADFAPTWFNASTFKENRLLYHEYLHFVQHSSTPYGLNVFLREADLIASTTQLLHELLGSVELITLPLPMFRDASAALRERIAQAQSTRHAIQEDLAVLQGACRFDPILKKPVFRNQLLSDENSCLFLHLPNQNLIQDYVPLGARAIMEGAASTLESVYLEFLTHSDEARRDLKLWFETKEDNPVYWLSNDLAMHYRGAGAQYRYILVALADLSLNTEIEWTFDPHLERPADQNPGMRFAKALEISRDLPDILPTRYHTDYYDFIDQICKRLDWKAPWDLDGKEVRGNITNHISSDYFGAEIVFLNGFLLREQQSSYCSLPINIFQDPREGDPKGGTIRNLEEVIRIHPPVLFTIADGSQVFTEFAQEAYSKWFIEGENVEKVLKSFKTFLIASELSDYVWNGVNGGFEQTVGSSQERGSPGLKMEMGELFESVFRVPSDRIRMA